MSSYTARAAGHRPDYTIDCQFRPWTILSAARKGTSLASFQRDYYWELLTRDARELLCAPLSRSTELLRGCQGCRADKTPEKFPRAESWACLALSRARRRRFARTVRAADRLLLRGVQGLHHWDPRRILFLRIEKARTILSALLLRRGGYGRNSFLPASRRRQRTEGQKDTMSSELRTKKW